MHTNIHKGVEKKADMSDVHNSKQRQWERKKLKWKTKMNEQPFKILYEQWTVDLIGDVKQSESWALMTDYILNVYTTF